MPDAPTLTLASSVEFHELVVHREPGREPLLGCPYVRRYLEVDDDTLLAVEAMRKHPVLGDAENALLAQTGEEWDVLALAQRLQARGFVRAIDGRMQKAEAPVAARHKRLYAVPTRALRWLHHPATLAASGVLLALWLAAMLRDATLRPRTLDLFLFHRPILVFLATTLGFLGFGYLHELAHFFVARSYDVDPKIKLGHRLYLLTLETDVSNAWLLPRRKQTHIFLAGILLNLFVASTLGLWLAGMESGWLPHDEWSNVLRFLVMLNVFPLALQLFFFTRTDLYFVLVAATGERNLLGDARGYVRLRARRLWRALAGRPALACAACGARVYADEPFCVRCGAARAVADPNANAFRARSRRRLLAFGLFFYAGQVAGLALVLGIGLRFSLLQIRSASLYSWAALGARDWLTLGEGSLALALALLQVGFLAYFLGKDVGARAWRALRR